MSAKKLWFYPLIFGILGALIGLVLRYAFTGAIQAFPFKNALHAHSHTMLLGFIFNALLILVWINFTSGIDKVSYKYFIVFQICMSIMIIAFLLQGYAFFSILFSTLQLWISYILLIRLWKRLHGNKKLVQLIKLGIIFHFLSSLGPYALGPLMALGMKESPWYQQAIFFYLHFQFLGLYFTWILALLFKSTSTTLNNKQLVSIGIGLVFLYAHSLEYSFNNWIIQSIGSIGSVLLLIVLSSYYKTFKTQEPKYKYIYLIILFVGISNVLGSIPIIAQQVIDNRFVLIAWFHFLFLGLYTPFIWVFLNNRINTITWFLFIVTVILSEAILVFPKTMTEWFSVSVMQLLFVTYLSLFVSICIVHLNYIFKKDDKKQIVS